MDNNLVYELISLINYMSKNSDYKLQYTAWNTSKELIEFFEINDNRITEELDEMRDRFYG